MAKNLSVLQRNGSELEKLVIPDAGPILRQHRQNAKLSIDDVAERTRMDRSQISRYESGEVRVNLRVLEALALAIGQKPQKVIAECQASLLQKLRDRYGKASDLVEMVEEIRRHVDAR